MQPNPPPPLLGLYTTEQAIGAIPNGSRVQKTNTEPDDAHQDGALAVVLGSICHPDKGLGYFVVFDDAPDIAVLIVGKRIALCQNH
jgi:hypothetical protein